MRQLRLSALSVLTGLLIGSPPAFPEAVPEVTVFAAASLSTALRQAGDRFSEKGGMKVKFSFAASSILAKQIEAGAGASLFLSADEDWMDYLAKRTLLATDTRRPLLGNRLVLVVPVDRPINVGIVFGTSWLGALPAGRIATGDPAHVPVGKYARQALTSLGAWTEAEPRLARADNVRNALVLVERGEASAGIVYGTDAAASKGVVVAGTFPQDSHDPISYPIALLRGRDQSDARKFYDFLTSPEAREIFARFGFIVR